MEQSFTEKRQYKRIEVTAGLRFLHPDEAPVWHTFDISKSGMFLPSEKPCSVGDEIPIDLSLPGVDELLVVEGRVVRVVIPEGSGQRGMGVEFIHMSSRVKAIIDKFVDGLLQEYKAIVLVTEDEHLRKMAWRFLEDQGHRVMWIRDWREIPSIVKRGKVDLVACDIGEEELDPKILKTTASGLPLVIMGDSVSPKVRQRAVELGIYEILDKPLDPDRFLSSVLTAIERRKSESDAGEGVPPLSYDGIPLVVSSPLMHTVSEKISIQANKSLPCLVTGESGTGKGMVVQLIHGLGPRAKKGLTVVDCTQYGSLDKKMLISELFGHEKEAFTGATKMHKGLVEKADGGTLFLDEIGELPVECQRQLYRVVDEGKFRRLGGNKDLKCNVRIIAASSRDLRERVQTGEFEKPLYYRLRYHHIHVPALRERMEDIETLALKYIEKKRREHETEIKYLGPEARKQLMEHSWPGNVRDLWGAIEESLANVEPEGDTLPRLIIEQETFRKPESGKHGDHDPDLDLQWKDFKRKKKGQLEEEERRFLTYKLQLTNGVVTEAAELAVMTHQNLSKKLKKLGINPNDLKQEKRPATPS